jgi:hypothetical protein
VGSRKTKKCFSGPEIPKKNTHPPPCFFGFYFSAPWLDTYRHICAGSAAWTAHSNRLRTAAALSRGTPKKPRRTPTWLVGSSEAKKVPGLVSFFDFFVVFLNSPHRETSKKRDEKIEKKTVLDSFVDFFAKRFL